MINIQTFLLMPFEYIKQHSPEYRADYFYKYSDVCFANIENHNRLSELIIIDDEFDPDYTMMSLVIADADKVLIDLKLIELNIWTDILNALEEFLQIGKSNYLIGSGTQVLQLSSLDNEQVHWRIIDEIGLPLSVYYDAIVNKEQLVTSLIKGGIHYNSTLLKYDVPNKNVLERELNRFNNLRAKYLNQDCS